MAPKKLSGQDQKVVAKYSAQAEKPEQVGVLMRLNPIPGENKGYMGVMYQDIAGMKDIEGATLKAYRSYDAAPGFRHEIGMLTSKQAERIVNNSFAYTDETGHITASAKVHLKTQSDSKGEHVVPDLGVIKPNNYVKKQLEGDPAGLVDRYTENANITKGLKDIRTAAFEQAKGEHAAQRANAQPKSAEKAEAAAEQKAARAAEKAAANEARIAERNDAKAATVSDYLSSNEDARSMSVIGSIHPAKGGAFVQVYPNTLVGETDIPNFNVRGSFFTDEQLDVLKSHAKTELDENGKGGFYTTAKLVKADPETVAAKNRAHDVYTIDLDTLQGDGKMTKLLNSEKGPETIADALQQNKMNMDDANKKAKADAELAAKQVETPAPVVESVPEETAEVAEPAAELADDEQMGF